MGVRLERNVLERRCEMRIKWGRRTALDFAKAIRTTEHLVKVRRKFGNMIECLYADRHATRALFAVVSLLETIVQCH